MNPLAERDPNYNGRHSRGSNLSNGSRGPPAKSAMMNSEMLANAPGVMSMLRSSTESGNEGLFHPTSRFAKSGRPPMQQRRSGTSSRISTRSGHSSTRRASTHRGSSHHAGPSVSSGGARDRRRSITSNISNLTIPHYLDTLPLSLANLSDNGMGPPAPHFGDGGGRSFSLTNSIQNTPLGLSNYRSLTSLRGHEPYHRPRSPYKYPTRLKRPGYRPSSPALSDMSGLHSSRSQHARLGSGLRMAHRPGLPPITRPAPLYASGRNRSNPSIYSLGAYDHIPGAYPGSRQGTPSITDQSTPSLTPGLTPHLTHMTPGQYPALQYACQPSSDPPSSTPPTPCEVPFGIPSIVSNTALQTRVPTPASSIAPHYYDYSEHFDLLNQEVVQAYKETTNAPIPMGFVQRIKTILEERSVIDHASLHSSNSRLVELPASEIHELPATPIIRRITREFILANLEPFSDSQDSTTPSVTQILEVKAENDNIIPETVAKPGSVAEMPSDHERQDSAASQTTGTASTTATAAMEYALHYSTRSNMSLQSASDLYVAGDKTLKSSASRPDEPTEPVTTAIAQVEVAAPTPTHIIQQPPWTPKLQTPIDAARCQSAVVSSSVYSSSHKEIASRFSTPVTHADWPLKEEGSNIKRSHSSHAQQPSTTSQKQRVSEEHYSHLLENNHTARRSNVQDGHQHLNSRSSSQITVTPTNQPVAGNQQPQQYSESIHSQHSSNPRRNSQMDLQQSRQSYTFPAITFPTAVLLQIEQPTQVVTYVASPVSYSSEIEQRASRSLPSPVSPLSPEDNTLSRREGIASAHLSSGAWSYRKPVPTRANSPISTSARTSIHNRDSLPEQNLDQSTTELRFSNLRPLARQLDDVKEEPSLEHSSVDLRSSTFRFPLPRRKSSLAHFESFRLSSESRRETIARDSVLSGRDFPSRPQSRAKSRAFSTISEPKAVRESLFRPPSGAMSLADMRSIPSLNFSRVDLFAKLNDALDLRRTGSIDGFPQLTAPLKERPLSSGLMREKYKSFFQTLDGMTTDRIPDINNDHDGQEQGRDHALAKLRRSLLIPSRLRPMSADEFLEELDRISIPSINGLTQRLSELLPSLRRFYSDAGEVIYEDETVRSALDEIRKLGQTLEGDDNDNEDATHKLIRNGVVAGLLSSPEDNFAGSHGTLRAIRPRSASSPGLQGDLLRDTPMAELEAPCAAVLRPRSLSLCNRSPCVNYNRQSRQSYASERSKRSSPAGSRPWNLDTNYPWGSNTPSIDISLPAPTLRRDVVQQRPSKLRLRMHRDNSLEAEGNGNEGSSDRTVHADATESTGVTSDTFGHAHKRKLSKRSILGSLSRKMGLGNSFDQGGFATSRELLGGEDRTVDPGDRYPTTGLSPPSALNIDEVRSFFSDDSSAHGIAEVRGFSFRKRFTNLRTHLPPVVRAHSALERRCAPASTDLRRSNSLFVPNNRGRAVSNRTIAATNTAVYGDEVVGMPKTEFRAKKLVERMRALWYKSGEILRSLSGKKKKADRPHDWEDSGESAHWDNV